MKRFINLFIPVTTCNLRCQYCYIAQEGHFAAQLPEFRYSAEHIVKALSVERLGGICHINICGGGETLLPPEITDITHELLRQGHNIMIVNNGTVSKRFDELLDFDEELLKHLGFKFSFHYLEFLNKGLMQRFLDNVSKVREKGCSYSIEMTPHDELIPYIPEIKEFCMNHFGALCHVTVARNTQQEGIPILTKLTREEYATTWEEFDSDLFRFKMSTFNNERKEYCYAGDWSLWVNAGNGTATQCYGGSYSQNIFDDITKPIRFMPIGMHCNVPHCHNSHALLTMGCIPEMDSPTYIYMRDRVTKEGNHWMNAEMREFLDHKLIEENNLYSEKEKTKLDSLLKREVALSKAKKIVKKIVTREK